MNHRIQLLKNQDMPSRQNLKIHQAESTVRRRRQHCTIARERCPIIRSHQKHMCPALAAGLRLAQEAQADLRRLPVVGGCHRHKGLLGCGSQRGAAGRHLRRIDAACTKYNLPRNAATRTEMHAFIFAQPELLCHRLSRSLFPYHPGKSFNTLLIACGLQNELDNWQGAYKAQLPGSP